MRCWLGGLAILLGGIVSLAQAEYIIIQVNIGVTNDQNQAGPGQPGVGGPAGAGMMGPRGGGGMNLGEGNSGGAPMGPRGGGMQGPPGGMGPRGGGMQGPPGGMGPRGGMQGPGGSGMGPRGGMMPPGGPGGPGGPGMGMPPGVQGEDEEELPSKYIVSAIVEVKGKKLNYLQNLPRIDHKWGSTILFKDDVTISVIQMSLPNGRPVPTVAQRFLDRKREAEKAGKPTPDKILDLAEWALSHALLTEFNKLMDDYSEQAKDTDVAKAYQKVKADLAKPLPENPLTGFWRQQMPFRDYKMVHSKEGHYTILYGTPPNRGNYDVDSKLNHLEDTYRSFFYWFAIKGKPLPAPASKLIAVVVPSKQEFERQHQIFDNVPLVADGFLARRDNLAIISADRLDEGYEGLIMASKDLRQRFEKDLLLKAKGMPRTPGITPEMWVRAQTIQLLVTALEEEAELATITHEGARQLVAATGLLPRSVMAPEWIQFGIGSFFETPKGAAWATVGAPSLTVDDQYGYLHQYKTLSKSKKADKPEVALEKVVSDKYFKEVDAAALTERDKDKAKELKHRALVKARTMAWALTYFLAHSKRDGLFRYYAELSKLPRDLDLEDSTKWKAFARAFELINVSKPDEVDPIRVKKLSEEWNDFMSRETPELDEVLREVKKKSELRTGTIRP
jgi:hypothetical protein